MTHTRDLVANTWHNSARPYRLFLLDGRAFFPMVFFAVYISWTTAAVMLAFSLAFGSLEYFKLPLPMFWRWLRSRLPMVGRHRPARPRSRKFL